MKRQRKPLPWKRRQNRLMLLFALLIVIPLFPALIVKPYLRYQIKQENNILRGKGYPVSDEDLRAWLPTAPRIQEEAPAFVTAMAALAGEKTIPSFKSIQDMLRGRKDNERLSAQLRDSLQAYIQNNAAALQCFKETMTSREYCVAMNPFDAIPPFVFGVRIASDSCALEAERAAEDGDPQHAADAILATLASARLFKYELNHLVFMYSIFAHWTAADHLQRALGIAAFSEAQLRELQTAISETTIPDALTRCLLVKRVEVAQWHNRPKSMIKESIEHMSLYRKSPAGTIAAAYVMDILGWNLYDQVCCLRAMNTVIPAAHLPYAELQRIRNRIYSEILQADFAMPPLSRSFISRVYDDVDRIFRDSANMRMALVAIAAERYRLIYGKPPERLDDLVPTFLDAVPKDPFDDQPLRYRASGNSYMIYSVSENLIDDTSNATDKDLNPRARNDMLFMVNRP